MHNASTMDQSGWPVYNNGPRIFLVRPQGITLIHHRSIMDLRWIHGGLAQFYEMEQEIIVVPFCYKEVICAKNIKTKFSKYVGNDQIRNGFVKP